jgi:hypothetical protein
MPSIIEQIQMEALRSDAQVGGLLRKVKLAAAKLKLDDLQDWVESELNGYKTKVPDYRVVTGELIAFNPYNGWIPVNGRNLDMLRRRSIGQPITAIEDIISNRSHDARLHVPMPPKVVEWLDQHAEIPFGRYALMIDRGAAVQVVEAVRNLVLEWSIEMERLGVTGSDFSFTPEERQAAQAAPSIHIGSVGTMIGNVGGTGNRTDHVTVGNVDVKAAADLAAQVKRYAPQLYADGLTPGSLDGPLEALRTETVKRSPNQGVIRGALTDLRNALSGASGSLLASGVIEGISRLIG